MSIVRQGTLPVGSLDHAITLNVQSSGGSHFETVTDTTPYLHRVSPQDVASSMKLKKVVGGTIAWNQLMVDTWSVNLDVANNQRTMGKALPNGSSIRTGHKYLYRATITASENLAHDGNITLYTRVSGTNIVINQICFMADGEYYIIFESSYNATADGVHTSLDGLLWLYSYLNASDTSGKATISHVNLIDLTIMFGSTIADYIYSLEQAHAGDGVAWFKALFGEDYYPYNAGELLSVKTSARKTYNADNVEIGSYALDSNLTLRGIPKLDGNNELYYDGDTYASDGTVTRRYGVVDLGSLTWVSDSTSTTGKKRFWADLPNSVASDSDANGVHSVISNGIKVLINAGTYYASTDGYTITILGKIYIFMDSLSTGTESAFKTAMDGVYLVYELATPTTESADAYTQAQRVGATEEFVDGRTVEIPVGNVSEYKRLIQGGTP